jgi:GDP-L-fucose synthase
VRVPAGTYLVLGATGLVGSHAVAALRAKPDVHVRAVIHERPPAVFGENVNYVRADLLSREGCQALMSGVDYVLMFAGRVLTAPVIARDPVGPVMDNLVMTAYALEAAYRARVRKCVWLSSTTGYPAMEGRLTENEMFAGEPPDVYYQVGWTTRYLETLCRMYAEKLQEHVTTVALRPSMIYGEYDDFAYETAHFLPALVRRVVERQDPVELWGTGEERRDLVHAADVVDACLRAVERVDGFEALNIASGRTHSVNELLRLIIRLDGYVDARVVHIPAKSRTLGERSFDTRRAKDVLGFEATISIEDGLARTITWYRGVSGTSAALAAGRGTR